MKIIKISTEFEMTIHDFPEGTMREQNKVLCELIGNGCDIVEHVMPNRLYTMLKMSPTPTRMPGECVSMLIDEEGRLKPNRASNNGGFVMEGKVTVVGRTKILRARAGEITLPKIVGFAFGSGGSNGSTVLSPGETLKNEFLRKAVDGHTLKTNENKCEYYCTLNGSEANGKSISEIGLYDSEGDIIMIANFLPKGKDSNVSMRFEIDDVLQ